MKIIGVQGVKHIIKGTLLSLLPLLLAGCSTYSETFECPPGKGVGCASLSAVNEWVDEGKLPKEPREEEKTAPPREDFQKIWLKSPEAHRGFYIYLPQKEK